MGCLRKRGGKKIKPSKSSGEQQELSKNPADGRPRKGSCSPLKNESCQSRDQRVDHQVSPRRSKDLSDATGTCGTEYRQSCCALRQVECQRREAALAAERQTNQQHAEVLNG